MAAAEWYVATDGCQKGPFSTPELRRWIRDGKLSGDALVKEGPNGPWRLVRELDSAAGGSGGQALLNLIGLAALLAIGAELFLFMSAHAPTKELAPWALGLYLLGILCFWSRWTGKKPAGK